MKKRLISITLPSNFIPYLRRWKEFKAFRDVDTKVFVEWALSIAVEEFEKEGGTWDYGATYADYIHFVELVCNDYLTDDWCQADVFNGWNLIVTTGSLLRDELDFDYLNRLVNPNLDYFAVETYNEQTGICIIRVLEEE